MVGFFRNLWDTIQYIRINGWVEYRKARKRYDQHMKGQNQKVTKRDRIEARQQMMKMGKGK